MAKVVLVTGVSRLVGGLTARTLSMRDDVERVIAVDSVPPRHSIGRAHFVRADIRNPMIGKIISQECVDTVLHAGVILTRKQAGGRASQKEINVMGTMQLLAACQRAESLERFIVKSSSAVYGNSPRDPALFAEEQSARSLASHGFGKDSVEVESYVRGFARRRPDVQTLTLRMANVIGRDLPTALSDLFTMPVVPLPLGYDGRLQVLHLDDAIASLVHATFSDAVGTINVAGDGVITMRQAVRLARRPFVPVIPETAPLVQQVASRFGIGAFDAEQMAMLCFGRGMDTTRMREILQFDPSYSTRDAFEQVFAPVRRDVLAGVRRG